MEHIEIEDSFTEIGGQFISSAFDLNKKLENIKAFVFDWDGVFNAGYKGGDHHSGFSEIDAMGVNLLRFGYYLEHKQLPVVSIITGAENPVAEQLAKREHYNSVYKKALNKQEAFTQFCQENSISPNQVCFVFDDVLDISIAKQAGINLAVGRLCNPVFLNYLSKEHVADYISACQGNEHAVREFTELLLCLLGKFEEAVEGRAMYTEDYQAYLKERNSVSLTVSNLDLNNKRGIGYKANG